MQERSQSRLASFITLLVGIWVAISPIWLSISGAALVSTIIVGCVIGVLGIVQYYWENVVPSWIIGLAAIWLFISMLVFSTVSNGMLLSGILSAIAAFILAIWDGAEVAQSVHHHQAAV